MNSVRRHQTALSAKSWVWLFVALVAFKAAVPLLSALAASQRGVPLAEVCTVYGVRTVGLEQSQNDDGQIPAGTHTDDARCILANLLAGSPLSVSVQAGVPTPESQLLKPQGRHAALAAVDAPLRWLLARLHAPPTPV